MTREVSRSLPVWVKKCLLPLSTIGVLMNFICSIVTVFYLHALGEMPVTVKDLIINSPTSLPARILFKEENIPLEFLRKGSKSKLLREFGFPKSQVHLGKVAVILFHISGILMCITTGVIIYQNIMRSSRTRRAPSEHNKAALKDNRGLADCNS